MSAPELKDVPEFVETEIGESILARTECLASFRELGPPDLCQIIKSTMKPGPKEIGSYHYVSGVDASSSATLAAYLNSLTYALEESPAWFTSKSLWKIRSGVFCSFNAFSRVDVRVEVKIPGGVEAYVVDLRGERHDATTELWQETYVSSVLRAILYSDDSSYRLPGYRKLNPIANIEAEHKFLEAAEALFFKGWQLGSDPEIQVATVVDNHLSAGIMKYFGESVRYAQAVNLFEKLYSKDSEVAALLAKAYIGMDEETKAISVLHQALQNNPMSSSILHVQVDFLRKKNKLDHALKLAKQAVNCAPSEFVTWAKLTEVYIDLRDYKSALLTLNSCPMFSYNERDMHRMPPPQKTHFPIRQDIGSSGYASGIFDDDNEVENEADIALLRLPAPSLRGTFSKAYYLLTILVSRIGWDELLRCRSSVFVMEEEYRKQKADEDRVKGTKNIENPAKLHSPNGVVTNALNQSIPQIRISSESDHDAEESGPSKNDKTERHIINGSQNGDGSQFDRKPINELKQSAFTKDVDADGEFAHSFSLNNKRLCERWLDNLFMVLYEDLRVYTIWRAELSHFKTQHMTYRKTGTEWEILGDLAIRLQHKEEAKEAYQKCLEQKFSAKAWLKLLEIFADEGDTLRTLQAGVKLTVYNSRWYSEMTYPTVVAKTIYQLMRKEGMSKMVNVMISMNLPADFFRLMQGFFDYAKIFRIEGSDL